MASTLKPPQPSTSKPPKIPIPPVTNTIANSSSDPPNPNPSSNSSAPSGSVANPNPLSPPPESLALSRATHLTRPEVLRLRSHRLKQLARCYRDHYWALMEELKVQYREYYWEYGVSPFREAHVEGEPEARDAHGQDIEGSGENGNSHNNNAGNYSGVVNNRSELDAKSNSHRCAFVGCKLKAMALTSFCHLHILSDPKQKLYKPCIYVIKSAQAGPITCGKPILRSTTPSLCAVHSQKFQKHVGRALRKGGLNVSSSSKLAPKFHILVAEYVHQIQAKRRAAPVANKIKVEVKEEAAS